MSNLTFRTDFYDQPKLRKELIRFVNQIHGLDLTLWDELGFWDRKYRPFSFFDGDRMVANACLFSMQMRVNGVDCLVAQISGVGTDPEYRKQGLAYELDKMAMDWARENSHEFFYLFADHEAFRLYKKCGFRIVDEYKSRIKIAGKQANSGAVKLDVTNSEHLDLIYRLACDRTPVSNLLGVKNNELFIFWCLYFLKDTIYYIKELELLVLFERNDGKLIVSDIVGATMPAFSDIYPYISDESDSSVEFLFMTDRLSLIENEYTCADEISGTHLCGDFPLEGQKFILPLTARA